MKIDLNLALLDRLRLGQKFLLLGVFALGAVAVPTVSVLRTSQSDVAVAQLERSGLPAMTAAHRAVDAMQRHRGLSATLLAGNEGVANQRAAAENEVNRLVTDLDRQLSAAPDDDGRLHELWNQVKQDWKTNATAVTVRSQDARTSFDANTVMINRTLQLMESIADHYKLSLDSRPGNNFLVAAVSTHIPQLAELLGRARGFGASRLADATHLREMNDDPAKAISAADRALLTTLLAGLHEASENSYRFLDKAMAADPALRESLSTAAAAPTEAARQLERLVKTELLDKARPDYDSAKYFKAMTAGIDVQYKLLAAAAATLEQQLEATVAAQRRAQALQAIGIAVALALAGAVGFITTRNVRRTVSTLQNSVEKVRAGDMAALSNVESRDEVGDLGRTVNELLQERIAALHRAEAENEALNNSVISLLQSVHQLSQRDLTAKAPVTTDVIGTVSDSINLLTDETARVLHGVTQIADQVANVSGKVKSQAELVTRTAEEERAGVSRMIESLNDATHTMNTVVSLSEQSNASAAQATQATDAALETVTGTVKGMESIRETIAETEKRIKRLGERSQEISGIVNLINTISERTHVLSLNASMQAAVAGEAGRGFAVVAEEVQRLAESSRNATQQIAQLVNNIQIETNETIATVNRTIGQVVQGSELAQRAGEQMRRTQEITALLVDQVRHIGRASDQQKSVSALLLESVNHIGRSTERTAEQIAAQNEETETLLRSARQLVDSVNVFKLPAIA